MLLRLFLLCSLLAFSSSQFCNRFQGTLCIRDQPLNVSAPIISPTNGPILINNTQVICTSAPTCSIVIITNSNITINNSLLLSPFINISTPTTLTLNNSELSTNGTVGVNQGSTIRNDQGNAFLGLGAFCGQWQNATDLTYGATCDSLAVNNQMKYSGSGGSSPFTYGGGFINITAKSVLLQNATLSASGYPLSSEKNQTKCQNVSAGTGGTIGLFGESFAFSGDTKMFAEGGSFCEGNGFAGAGGKLIVTVVNLSTSILGSKNYVLGWMTDSVILIGGRNTNNSTDNICRNGAVGSFCIREPNINSNEVLIDGKSLQTSNPLLMNSIEWESTNNTKIVGGALVSFKTTSDLTQKINVTMNSWEISESTFTDGFMAFANLYNITYNIKYSFVIREGSQMNLIIKSNFLGISFQSYDSKIIFHSAINIQMEIFIISSTSILGSSDFSMIIANADSLDLNGNSSIVSSFVALFSKNPINLDGSITSKVQACTLEEDDQTHSKFFNFILPDNKINITQSFYVFKGNNETNFTFESFVFFVGELLYTNFTVLFVSESDVAFSPNFKLKGSSIGIFSSFLDIFPNASISTTGMGCQAFEGPGAGTKIYNAQYECGGNGASHGGFQGFGFGEDPDKSDLCKQFATDFAVKYGDPFYPKFQGSGGGGQKGGSGGGIIFINILNTMMNDGSIESNGQSIAQNDCRFVNGSGAGSGGSIQIYSMGISGAGNISANGGSTYDYCGEGGGGRILVFFYNWEHNSNIQSLLSWKGLISAKSGQRIITIDGLQNVNNMSFYGTEGTLFTSPCTMGYYAPYSSLCKPCPVNTFKDIPGYEPCSPCLNKPSNSYYTNGTALKSVNCPFQCEYRYGNVNSTSCENIIQAYYDVFNGVFIPAIVVITLAVIVFGRIMKSYIKKRLSIKNYDYEELERIPDSPEKIQKLKMNKKLQVADLFFHVHRINIYGTNKYDNRWFLKSEPPEEIVYLVSIKQYRIFVHKLNKILSWHWSTTFFMRTLAVVYYPCYAVLLSFMRKRKFLKMKKFLEKNENYFWSKNNTNEVEHVKMKLSSSREYTLGFLDILCYKNASTKYFNMTHPITLMLAGEGSFFRPFFLDTTCPVFYTLYISLLKKLNEDPEFKSVNKDDYIERIRTFVLKFNKISCSIEFSSPCERFVSPIWELLTLIEVWNTTYFYIFGYKLDLLIMQIPKEKYSNYENTITLLETKDFENFKRFIREVHTIKSEYSLYDVRFGLFCLNLETEDKNFFPVHRRISFMIDDDEYFSQKQSTNNNDIEENDIIQLKF